MTIATPVSRSTEFRERLSNRTFVADGAMGSMLYSRGVFINRCFDELNLTAPRMIAEIHAEYAAAGAEILETNTFGANRARLAGFGLADKTEEVGQYAQDNIGVVLLCQRDLLRCSIFGHRHEVLRNLEQWFEMLDLRGYAQAKLCAPTVIEQTKLVFVSADLTI